MYAVMNVVFGIAFDTTSKKDSSLCDQLQDWQDDREEDEIEEGEGFCCPYNGGGDGWAYFGLDVANFEEVALTYLDEQNWAVTPELEERYKKLVEKIEDDELRKAVLERGKPRMVIVPSTS